MFRYIPTGYGYINGVNYRLVSAFLGDTEVERAYKGDDWIYQRRWWGDVVLPPLYSDIKMSDDPEPISLTEYMENLYCNTYTVQTIQSLNNLVELDDIGEPIEYHYFNDLINIPEYNIMVNIIAPYGNYAYYEDWEYNEQTGEDEPSGDPTIYQGYMGFSYNANRYPLYFYCENSSNLYYNEYPFSVDEEYSNFLSKDDLTSGPRYDYVLGNIGFDDTVYGEEGRYINANFNSITNIREQLDFGYYGLPLKRPLKTPAVVNMSHAYSEFYFLEKAYCGKYTINMGYSYAGCSNLINAVCGDNVRDLSYAYARCYNLKKAVCGNNVIDMRGSYQYCYNLTGKAACGDNVETLNYAYNGCTNLLYPNIGNNVINAGSAYSGCSNLELIKITPSLQNIEQMYYGVNDRVEEIIINRKDSNLNIDPSLIGTRRLSNCKKINIIGDGNFKTFYGEYYMEGGIWNYRKAYSAYQQGLFFSVPNLEELYVCDGMKDMCGWFSGTYSGGMDSFSKIKTVYIPSSVESYSNTFASTGVTTYLHNINGGRSFYSTYSNCINLTGELYIPESAEYISNMANGCRNLTSVKFNRNCKVPYLTGPGYILNSISYYGPEFPFYGCINLTDIQLSDYIVTVNDYDFSYIGSGNYFQLKNIVFYNNDDQTIKNIQRAFERSKLPSYDGHYINIYVPDSTDVNSFNYALYTDSGNIFYNYSNHSDLEWTLFDNGYYNEQYKIRVINNYDYENDSYR